MRGWAGYGGEEGQRTVMTTESVIASLRCPILKPCKFAAEPACDHQATADRQSARHMYTRSRA
jgi:hypothetical protein